jgi:CheY-like chemotaxis protein
MDVNMPVMDGLEATRHIRAAEASGRFAGRRPVIAMTANVLREAVEECMKAGMDGFISKPFTRAQINEELGRWLQVRETGEAALAPVPPCAGEPIDIPCYRRVEEAMGPAMNSLVAEFIATTTRLLQDIAGAAQRRDRITVKLRAHALRSSTSVVGAAPLSDLAATLEARASREGFADAEAAVPLQSEFKRACDVLERLASSNRSDAAACPDAQQTDPSQHAAAL